MRQRLTEVARAWLLVTWLSLSGCATVIDDGTESVIAMPARSTSESEIAAAIQKSIKTFPICATLIALQLVGKPVNFHEAIERDYRHQTSEATLDVLVRLGYLTKTARLDLGWRVIEYQRTERTRDRDVLGYQELCLPAERKLLAVNTIERVPKKYPFESSGYLAVRFTHVLDPTSIWVQEAGLAGLIGGRGGALTQLTDPEPFEGTTSLYRVWSRDKHSLKGAPQSGELRTIWLDAVHNRYENGIWLWGRSVAR